MKHRNIAISAGVIILAVGGGLWWWFRPAAAPAYTGVAVKRADLTQLVRASGTVKPLQLVLVATQVSGPITKLFVDYNDHVTAGQIVAQIDPATYQARVEQDEATVKQGEAAVDSAKAKLTRSDADLARMRKLAARELAAQSDLDAAIADRDGAAADVKLAEARLVQSRAALRSSKTNLDYTTIRSPVEGVVLDRSVNEGQTVVASMSAQTLFSIATDLNTMQIETSVPEADIADIIPGKSARFRVDAFEETFTGVVHQIRLSPASLQNVVTYPVILHAGNPKMKLFPGMTANVDFEVAARTNCLTVPNAALRFSPEVASSKTPDTATASAARVRPRGRGPKVWIQPDPAIAPTSVVVRVGITDGTLTEILEPSPLSERDTVLTAIAKPGAAAEKTVNPFMPQMPGRRR